MFWNKGKMIILVLFSVHQGGVYCYASGGGRINACLEFKEMVKDLHLAGIEVFDFSCNEA